MTAHLPEGEKKVIEAFIWKEEEDKKKAIEEIKKSGMACPYALLGLL